MGNAVTRLVDAAYNKSILPVRVREAARMRIAQLNDCPVCLSFRAASVKEQGVEENFYTHVADHETSNQYSEPERLADQLRRLDENGKSVTGFHSMRFTDAEILDLTICLATFLGLGRLLRVLGIDQTSLIDV